MYCLAAQIVTSLFPIPNVDIPDPSTFWPTRQIVLWTATHVFHLPKPPAYADTGSGDRAFDWVLTFCLLTLAVLATAVWSILDRKRKNYLAMHKWFWLFIRFALAGQMISYGFAKAIPLQMPFPFLTRLLEPYGQFSPMGVLWSSIGASHAYEIFAGCAELLGGILLIFPRTTMLGALICLADATEIFVLNMTYDVPVKLLALHLILLSLFLLAPDFRRLIDFLFLNKTAAPSAQVQLFIGRRANRVAFAAQIAIGLWLLGMNAYGGWKNWSIYGGGRPKSPLYGIWTIGQQTVDGQLRPPLLNDSGRWRCVVFDFPDRAAFQNMDNSLAYFGASVNVQEKTLTLTKGSDKKWKASLAYESIAPDRMTLDGDMDGHRLHMLLGRVDHTKFPLIARGFHWIQEYPYNR